MSGEFEAAGALTTAGLAAGAIEGSEATREGDGLCANCGAQLSGRYCSQCGQAAHAHRSLLHMGEELLYGLFNFDTKLWRTLPMVFFRPGTLTRNYIFGKRARYISPLALFLFCVFFLFFVVSLVPAPVNVNTPATVSDAQEQVDDARTGVREVQRELDQLHRRMAREADPGDRAEEAGLQTALAAAQAELRQREQALAEQQAAERNSQPGVHIGTSVDPTQTGPTANITTATPAPTPPAAPSPASTTPAPSASTAPGTPSAPAVPAAHNPYPPGSLENALYGISQDNDIRVDGNPAFAQQIRHKLENPPLLLYQLQEAASKFSFLLVPISLPFIAFLFLFKKNITFYDHTVFAFYSLCFASLLFVVLLATGSVPWLQWLPGLLITFGLPVHTYFHLKGAYALRWWSALWRTFFLLLFAIIALSIFLALVLIVGFAE